MNFWNILANVVVFGGLVAGGYYLFLKMVKANLVFAEVPKGFVRIILLWGNYHREIGPGLHFIGIPGAFKLYSRKMIFFKTVATANGDFVAEPHQDEDVSSFKTTRYPYCLPFIDVEDKEGLNLSGVLTVHGTIENYHTAFFEVSDWYAEVNSRVMTVWRDQVLPKMSYDEDIVDHESGDRAISERLWEQLTRGSDSVVDKLLNEVGFRIHSVDLPAIDPPEGWRATTLAPYKAKKEREAAVEQAKASAALMDDTRQALALWLKEQGDAVAAGTRSPVTTEEIQVKQRELRDRALAKTAGYQQVDIRGVEGAGTIVIGGGAGAGVLVGDKGEGKKGKPKGGSSSREGFEDF